MILLWSNTCTVYFIQFLNIFFIFHFFLKVYPGPSGFPGITDDDRTALVNKCTDLSEKGRRIILRFAPEMNGSWFIYGQAPTLYKSEYHKLANLIRSNAPQVALLWSPSSGNGYPYPNGKYSVINGTETAHDLDTNGDGVVGYDDDPYSPYYPESDLVDWVGLSM